MNESRLQVMQNKLLFITIFLMFAFVSNAAVLYVDADSPNDPGSGSSEDPFRRIQDAIDAAQDGDAVEIQPGVYTGYHNYDLNPSGKSITIRSIDDPNAPVQTIIDPGGMGRGFYFGSGEDPNCIVSGITIRNGYAMGGYGGGIYCASSNPVIIGCIIENSVADSGGGGIFCYHSSPELIQCVIQNNQADDGGGISCYYSSPRIIECTIENNIAALSGGGFYGYEASPAFVQCIIRNNQGQYDGGGLEISGGDPEMTHCIISNNHASGYGGGCDFFYHSNPILGNCVIAGNSAATGGGVCSVDSSVVVKNDILWENQASEGPQLAVKPLININLVQISYSDLQGGRSAVFDPCDVLVWGSGNINTDPCFVSFDPNGSPELWDFHLQSIYGRWDVGARSWITDTNSSPCLDKGDPNSDWINEPWPNGKRANIGAYGGTGQASKNGNLADFNLDKIVDLADFLQLSEQWLESRTCIEDLNLDDEVNSEDIYIFIENWLWEENNPADFNGDDKINLTDFAQLSDKWLVNSGCNQDLNHDRYVNAADLPLFAGKWLWYKQ